MSTFRPRKPIVELEDLLSKSTASVAGWMVRLMAAIVRGDRDAERAAESRLADLIANSQALADAYGRRRIMLETAAIRKREPSPGLQLDLRSSAGPIDPGDTFGGALDAVLARDPVLARTRSEIRTAYSREHGFALIRSSKIEITKAVQRAVTKAIVAGESVDDAAKMIEKLGPFSRAYAETVYRTNVTTAYTAGRFRQARDPVVADVVKAMRYEAINDSVTRPAHAKLDGLIAAVDDPIWQKIAPPNGYNCRCTVELVSGADLKRKRLIGARGAVLAAKIPSDWNADPGFKNVGRPDLLIYG